MIKSLTEHVQSIGKEFDEILFSYSKHDNFEAVMEEIKTHFRYSQLKTIELLKEELEGMKKPEIPFDGFLTREDHVEVAEQNGYNSALSQAITLLDTIIQEVKLQMK